MRHIDTLYSVFTISALLSFHLTPDLSTFGPVWRCRSGLGLPLSSPVPFDCGAVSPPLARLFLAGARSSVPVTDNQQRTRVGRCLDPLWIERMLIMGKFQLLWQTNSVRWEQSLLRFVFAFPWQLFTEFSNVYPASCLNFFVSHTT